MAAPDPASAPVHLTGMAGIKVFPNKSCGGKPLDAAAVKGLFGKDPTLGSVLKHSFMRDDACYFASASPPGDDHQMTVTMYAQNATGRVKAGSVKCSDDQTLPTTKACAFLSVNSSSTGQPTHWLADD